MQEIQQYWNQRCRQKRVGWVFFLLNVYILRPTVVPVFPGFFFAIAIVQPAWLNGSTSIVMKTDELFILPGASADHPTLILFTGESEAGTIPF